MKPQHGTKKQQRQRALAAAGLLNPLLTSIDFLDAALCAITADALLMQQTEAFGNEREGKILLPREKYFSKRH